MESPTEIKVLELYRQDWRNAVVLQGLPEDDELDIDYLDTFVGWVLHDGDLKHVCQPVPAVSTAVIAIFENPINDVEAYAERLVKRKYKSKTSVVLKHLGNPAGIFLPWLPQDVDDEYIQLYFESKKKFGYSCNVGKVEVKVTATNSCATVRIKEDKDVLDVILGKSDHTMKGVGVNVEPYFPSYHDYVMEQIPEDDMGNSSPKSSTGGNSMEIEDQDISMLTCCMLGYIGGHFQMSSAEDVTQTFANILTVIEKSIDLAANNLAFRSGPTMWGPYLEPINLSRGPSEEKASVQQLKNKFESPPRDFDLPVSAPLKFVNAPREAWKKPEEAGGEDNLGTDVDANYFAQSKEQKDEGAIRKHPDTSWSTAESSRQTGNWIFSEKQSNTSNQEENQDNDISISNIDLDDDNDIDNDPENGVRDSLPPMPRNVFTRPQKACLLDCIVDGLEDIDINSGNNNGQSEPVISPQRAQHTREGPGCVSKSNPKPSPGAKPKFRSPKRSDYDPSLDCDRKHHQHEQCLPERGNEPQRQGKNEHGKKKHKFTETGEVQVSKVAHIILLKNSRYVKPSNKVSIFLDEKQCKVIIRANSSVDITAEKLRLHEHLSTICELTEKLTVHKAEFFSERQTLGQIRFLCKKDKLEVAMHVSLQPPSLHCLAFKEEEANKGLQLLKDKLQVKNVKLREGQLELLRGQSWSDFLGKLKGTLGMAYISDDNSKVMVEGFTGKTVETTRQKVVDFLKENVVRVTTKFELNGAEAKCFQNCMQRSLDRRIREKHGSIRIEVVKADYPMKLNLTVEGDEVVTKEAKDCLDKIAKEQLDFRKVSTDRTDVWLMMRGLAGEKRKPFLQCFEQDNNCFINVTEEGQMEPPPREVKQERVSTPPSTQPQPLHGPPDVAASRGSPVLRRHDARDRQLAPGMSIYQPANMGEDEVLQMAKLKSMQCDESNDISPQQYPVREDCRLNGFLEERQAYGRPQEDYGLRAYVPQQRKHSLEDNQQNHPHRPYAQCSTADFRNNVGQRRRIDSPQFGKYERARVVDRDQDVMEQLYSRGVSAIGDGHRERNYSITMHGTKVVLQRGKIATFKADCLVNIVGSALKLDEGTVSKTFLKVGGPELNNLFQQSVQSGNTSVIGTQPCGLPCKSVYHVVLQKGPENCAQSIQTAVSQVLTNCIRWGCQSAAFPPLGVGRMYQYNSSAAAKAMLQSTENFLSKKRLSVVTFVIYDKDNDVFNDFKEEFKAWERRHSGKPFQHRPTQNPNLKARGFRGPRPIQAMPQFVPGVRQHTRQESLGRREMSANNDWHRRRPQVYNQHSQDTLPKDKATKKESRFPKDAPVKNLTVVVFAETRDKCLAARNKLGKAIKDEFLFEERLKKVAAVSPQVKDKIIQVITKHKVKSIKDQDGYIIKGHRDGVNMAHKEILQLLVDSGTSSDRALLEKKHRRKNAKRETQEYVRYMVEEDPDVPKYWKNFKPGQPIKSALLVGVKMFFGGKKYVEVKLDSADPIYNAIISMINKTWDSSKLGQGRDAKGLDQFNYTKMQVMKIERIENLELYHDYVLKRVKRFTSLIKKPYARFPEIHKLPGCTGKIQSVQHAGKCLLKDMNSEINEFYFFHGTKPENIRAICDSGLDSRLAGANAMFGQGIYGAETPSKADQYVDDQGRRTAGKGQTKQMFLMRMILGNAFICTDSNPHKYKRPPCTKCQRDNCRDHSEMYDSVVGDVGKNFREFVVYEKGLCYPEYLISYERL